jgi:PIN domain nuclease of toxin-antitoxin system
MGQPVGTRFLLDTHVVIWWLADDPRLQGDVATLIDEEVDVMVSAATVWEVAIKQRAGKIEAPHDLPEQIRDCELSHLPISSHHAIEAARLPSIHRDPFDRMLVAQARHHGLTLVTRDEHIQKYDVSVLPA